MQWSSLTLNDVIKGLPKRLQHYDAAVFGKQVANGILSDIEKLCDPDFLVKQSALFLQDGVTDYASPDSSLRKIRGIFAVNDGEVIPNREDPVDYSEMGKTIRLLSVPTLSAVDDILGVVDAGGPSSLVKVFDNTAGILDVLEDNILRGRLCSLTHTGTSVVENRIITGNDPAAFTISLNGNLDALALGGDTYTVTYNYLIIEFSRYLTRFTALTDVLDLPMDFEKAFRSGVIYYYYLQADEESDETKRWEKIYYGQLNELKVDASTQIGTALRRKPAPIASFQ